MVQSTLICRAGHEQREQPVFAIGSRPGRASVVEGSEKNGVSARPQPRERSPPKPESASRRNAAFTGSVHRSRASSSRNATRLHKPQPGANSMQAVEMRLGLPVRRSTAALLRTLVRNGPGVPAGTRHSLGPSSDHASSFGARAGDQICHQRQRHEARAFPAHFGRSRRAARACAAASPSRCCPMNGKQELKRTAGPPVRRRSGQPFLQQAQRAHGAGDRRVQRVAVIDQIDAIFARHRRARCARARWAAA